MIRGVNKQVIEVSATESEYFERAILFVRSKKSDLAHKELKRHAGNLLRKFGPPGEPRAASRLQSIVRLASAASMGAAASALLIKLVF